MENKELTEKQLQNNLGNWLKKFFDVYFEVWDATGKHRIDLILVHKSDLKKEFPIGIEIKLDCKKRGKDLANWLKQSTNYSTLNFKNFGKCIIFVYPQITFDYLNEGNKMSQHTFDSAMFFQNNINTFIGQYKVGEIMKYSNILSKKHVVFIYSGSKIWDSEYNQFNVENIKKVWK